VLRGRVGGGRVETAVGSFDVGGTNGHEAVDVLVRPELLELAPDPSGEGEVVARQFRGHDVFYEVRLDDGTRVFSQRPSNEHVPLGVRVSLRAHDGRVALLS
jgi:ABC-type Fe3+/spermidine/putrescine transport system ATPase subunit